MHSSQSADQKQPVAGVPILQERNKRDLYIKVFTQEFIRELQYLWDVANERATARSTFTEKLVDKLTALPEELPVVGKAIEKLGPVLKFAASEIRDEHTRCMATLFDQLDIRRLEILVDVVAREAYRRYEFFIEHRLGDDPEKCIIPFAKIGVARSLEYMARKKANVSVESYLKDKKQFVFGAERKAADKKTDGKIKYQTAVEFSESFLLAGLIEGRSGSFVQGWTNNKVLLNRTKTGSDKIKEIEIEDVYARSAMMQFEIKGDQIRKVYFTRDKARHKEKNWTADVDNIWRGESESLYDFGRTVYRGNKSYKQDPSGGFVIMPLNIITERYDFKEASNFSKDLTVELNGLALRVVEIDKLTLEAYVKWYRQKKKSDHTIVDYLRKEGIWRSAQHVICHGDLRNINLQGINLSNMDLSGAQFSGDLTDTQFNDSYLIGARFENVTSAKSTSFQRAHCAFLQAEKVDFSGANLIQADFSYANLSQATLTGCNTLGTIWHQTELQGIRLGRSDADLHQAQAEQLKKWQAEQEAWRAELHVQSKQVAHLMQLQKQMDERLEKLSEEVRHPIQEKIQLDLAEQEARRTFEQYCRQHIQELEKAVSQTADKKTVEDLKKQSQTVQEQISALQKKQQDTIKEFHGAYTKQIAALGEEYKTLKAELTVLQELKTQLQTVSVQQQRQQAEQKNCQQTLLELQDKLKKTASGKDVVELKQQLVEVNERLKKIMAEQTADEKSMQKQLTALQKDNLMQQETFARWHKELSQQIKEQNTLNKQTIDTLQDQQQQLNAQFKDRLKALDEKVAVLAKAVQDGRVQLQDVEQDLQKLMRHQESKDEQLVLHDKKLEALEDIQRKQALSQKEEHELLLQKIASVRNHISQAQTTDKVVKPLINPQLVISYFDLDFDGKLPVGQGTFAEIYLGYWRHQRVVIKRPQERTAEALEELIREVNIMERLRHRNVVQLYGASIEKDRPCLVMEYMEHGSLKDMLAAKTKLTLVQQISIAIDIAQGLIHIHQIGVIHRDLKSGNILINKYFQAKLADFGLAKINTNSISPTHKSSEALSWMPPEAFNHQAYTKQSDVYCFGILLWEIMTGKIPLENCVDHKAKILSGPEREAIPDIVPEACRKIIKNCWQVDPSRRPSLDKILIQLNTYKEALDCFDQAEDANKAADNCHAKAKEEKNADKRKTLEDEEKRHLTAAYTRYQQSLDKGNSSCSTHLAYFLLKGLGGAPKDPKKALEYYCVAAEQGDEKSMFNAARMFQKGDTGVAVDLVKSLHWYEKAANAGDGVAMVKAAEILEKGDKEMKADTHRALAWFEKAAKSMDRTIAEHAKKQCERLQPKK